MTAERWLGTPPTICDGCGKGFGQFFYDAKTRMGPWGLLCESCFVTHGVGLGIGKGQKYDTATQDRMDDGVRAEANARALDDHLSAESIEASARGIARSGFPKLAKAFVKALSGPQFALGQLVATPGALAAFETARESPSTYLTRHLRGDWGDLGAEDKAANDAALVVGTRLFSAYHLTDGTKVWIITEADRSVTTVLLPDEY